jgi:ribonuclease P protein component
MLPKKNRFQFRERLPKQTLNSQSFSIRYDKNEKELKVAVVVSKKVDKRAVIRNRIKRVIIEAVRLNLPKESNLTIIFYAKKEAVANEKLAEEVVQQINKLTKTTN